MRWYLKAAVWLAIWSATYSVVVWLCYELAGDQPIILAVLLLAGFVASVGPYYARESFRSGAWSSGLASAFVSALALMTALIGDISYWSGSIEGIHEQVTRDKAISDGKALVRTRQAERYSSLANGQSADRLQAEMNAALSKPIGDKTLGARTADCTDTASYHYRSCTGYLNLKAQFAAASDAAKLESVVGSFSTTVEPVGVKRDFYRAAIWGSNMTGWKVETCIAGIASIIVTMLNALLMLSIYIGLAPDRRKEAARAAKAPRGMDVAGHILPPAPALQAPAEYSFKRFASTKPDDTPPPADAKPVAELPGTGSGGGGAPVTEAKLLHGPWPQKEPEKPEPKLSAAEARRLETIEAVKAFADEVLSLDADGAQLARTPKGFVQSGGTPGKLLGKQFRLWAKGNRKWGHLATCSQNPLGKALSAVIESGRHSNSGQTVYAAVLKDEKKRAIG